MVAYRRLRLLFFQVYQLLRKKDENFHRRITVINGDLNLPNAGISDQDIDLLCNEVEIVVHAAADVRFNIPLMELVQSNVRGTRDILEMAKKMKHLEVFAYVSTAYSNCPLDVVEEKFYEPPMNPDFWLKMLDRCQSPEDKLIVELIEQHIMHPWPNSYTYTKALTENLVKRYSEHFPAIVIRPSIGKRSLLSIFVRTKRWILILKNIFSGVNQSRSHSRLDK